MDLCKINSFNIDDRNKKKGTEIALRGQVEGFKRPALLVVAVFILIRVICFSGNLLAAPIKVSSSETESVQFERTLPIESIAEYGEERRLLTDQELRFTKRFAEENSNENIQNNLTQISFQLFNNNLSDSVIVKERFREVKGHFLLLFALLVLINLIVIFGNILVILAVYATAKLRNVTNIFIVSLATADLLLGVFVLPYALMLEVLDVWIFGRIWCRGWLVTDVWISTASILNLCAISIDRYVAVTRPVKYRSIMTPPRAKTIVAAVWIVSFLICLPPLLQQWKPTMPITTASTSAAAAAQSSSVSFPIQTDTPMTMTTSATITTTTNKPIALGDFAEPDEDTYFSERHIQQIPTKISRQRRSIPQQHDDEPVALNYASTTPARDSNKFDITSYDNTSRAFARGSHQMATIWTLTKLMVKNREELLSHLPLDDTLQHIMGTQTLMTTDPDSDSSLPLPSQSPSEQLKKGWKRSKGTKLSLDIKTSRIKRKNRSKRKVLASHNGITSKQAPENGHAVDIDIAAASCTTDASGMKCKENQIRSPLIVLQGSSVGTAKLEGSQQGANKADSPQQVPIFLPVFFEIAHLHNVQQNNAKVSMSRSLQNSMKESRKQFNLPTVEREQDQEEPFFSIGKLFEIELVEEGRKRKISRNRERAKTVKFQMEVIRVIDNKLCLADLVSRLVEPKECRTVVVTLAAGGKETANKENVERTNMEELLKSGCWREEWLAKAENINDIISKLPTLSSRELVKAYLNSIFGMQTNKQYNYSYNYNNESNSNSDNDNDNKLAEKSLNRRLDLAKILIGELSLKQMKQAKDHDGEFGWITFKSCSGRVIVSDEKEDIKTKNEKEGEEEKGRGKLKLKRGRGRGRGPIKGSVDFEMQSLMKSSSLQLLFRSGVTQPTTTTSDSPNYRPTSTSATKPVERPPRSPSVNATGKPVAPTRSLLVSLPTMSLDLNRHNTHTTTTKPAHSEEENILEAIELLTSCTLVPYFGQGLPASYQSDNLNNNSDNKNNNNCMSFECISHNVRIRLGNSTFTAPLWRRKLASKTKAKKDQKTLLWHHLLELGEVTLLLFPPSNHENLARELTMSSKASLLSPSSILFLPQSPSHLSWPTKSPPCSLCSLFVVFAWSCRLLNKELKLLRPDIGRVVTMAPQGATTNTRALGSSVETTILVITGSNYFQCHDHDGRMEAERENGAKEQRLNSRGSVSRLATTLKWCFELVVAESMAVNFNQELALLLSLQPFQPPTLTTSSRFWRRHLHRLNQSVVESNRKLSVRCHSSLNNSSPDSDSTNSHFHCHRLWHPITLPDNDKSALVSGRRLLAILQSNTSGTVAIELTVEQMGETKNELERHIRQTIIPMLDYYSKNKKNRRHTAKNGCQMELRQPKLDKVARKFLSSLIANCLIKTNHQTKRQFELLFSSYFVGLTKIDYEYIDCPQIQCKFYDFKLKEEAKKILPQIVQNLYNIVNVNVHNDHHYFHNQNDHDKFYMNKVNINDKTHSNFYDSSKRRRAEDKKKVKREEMTMFLAVSTSNNLASDFARLERRLSLHKSVDKMKDQQQQQRKFKRNHIKRNTLLSSLPFTRDSAFTFTTAKTKVGREDEANNSQEDNYGDNEKINNGSKVGEQFTNTQATSTANFSQFDINESSTNNNTSNNNDWYQTKLTVASDRRKKSGCALFDDKPYVIYSALGSFYIPMLIMIFFYSRIYLVASRAQKAMRRGYMTTKWPVSGSASSGGGGSGSGRCGNGGKTRMGGAERVTLRIHRREKSPAHVPQQDAEEGVAAVTGHNHSNNNNNNNSNNQNHNQQSILMKLTQIERQRQQSISSNNPDRKESRGEKEQLSSAKLSGHQSHEDSLLTYGPKQSCNISNTGEDEAPVSEHDLLLLRKEGNSVGNVTSQQDHVKMDKVETDQCKQHLVAKEDQVFHSNHLAFSQVKMSAADISENERVEDKVRSTITLGQSSSSTSSSSSSYHYSPSPSPHSLCHPYSEAGLRGLLKVSDKELSREVSLLSSSSPPSEGNNNNEIPANEGAFSSERTIQEEEASSSRRCHMCLKRREQVSALGQKSESLVTKFSSGREEEDVSHNSSNTINVKSQSQRSYSLGQVLEHRRTRRHHRHLHLHRHHYHHHHHHHHHHHQQDHPNQHHCHHQHHCNRNHNHQHHHHHQLAQDSNQSLHKNHNHQHHNNCNDNRRRRCIPSQIEHTRCRSCVTAGIEKSCRGARLAAEMGINFQALANTKLEEFSSKTISDANELDRFIIHSCIKEEGSSNSNVPSSGENLVNLSNHSNNSDPNNNTCHLSTYIPSETSQHVATGLDDNKDNTECSNNGSVNSVQITVSQYDVCENNNDDDEGLDNIVNSGLSSIFVSITPPIEGASSKCERSKSVDVPSVSKQNQQTNYRDGNLLLEDPSTGRVDRSHSCGPAPTIVVNWNPDTENTESKLAVSSFNEDVAKQNLASKRSIASEGTLSIVVEKRDKAGEIAEAGGHAGSQGSGLSIMASIPQAAHQMRKQSKILLSSISTRSSQTLRRLSMVASHPVESLLGRSRSNSGSSKSSSSESSNNLSGDESENNSCQDKSGKRKKKKKRSNTANVPKKTFDDYLMAVAGVDGSSEDEEEEEGEQFMEEESLSDDSANYSLLFSRKQSVVVVESQEANLDNESNLETYDMLTSPHIIDNGEEEANDDEQPINKLTPNVKFSRDEELEKVEDLNSRPPSALHRQGAYYERATSRATTANFGNNNERKIFKVSSVLTSGENSTQTNGNDINNGPLGKNGGLVDANSSLKKHLSIPLALVANRAQKRRGAKRTSRWHAKRLHAETKAAKTVAIIIGGFIFCWLPFFTAYLSRAIICEKPDCIPQSLLSLFIWLGYLNSAINPVIYGLFSADFRHAFKNILCRCRIRNTDDTVVVSVLVDSIIKSIL